jgi:hypothetical protein
LARSFAISRSHVLLESGEPGDGARQLAGSQLRSPALLGQSRDRRRLEQVFAVRGPPDALDEVLGGRRLGHISRCPRLDGALHHFFGGVGGEEQGGDVREDRMDPLGRLGAIAVGR